ncbi:MAG: glycosyltransferase family 4 protein [Gammaproteobacteria bacterium]|nr:glycosyltransferase family 4 protein [Gammaproteobacteria bacterium]
MNFLLIASYRDSLLHFRGPLIDALLKEGLTVHVVAPDLVVDSVVGKELQVKGVMVHSVPMQRNGLNPIHDLATFFAFVRLVRRIKPIYVFSYTIKPVIYGTLAAALLRVPKRFSLITGLGYAFSGQVQSISMRTLLRKLLLTLYRVSLSFSHGVIFQNPDDKALFKQLSLVGVNSDVTVVNGSGVDVAYYNEAPFPEDTSFLLIARLLGDKGVREYVEAARVLKARYPKLIFKLVGWIDTNPDAIKQQELNGWIESGVIDYLGKVSDVRPIIADSSVYVLPSYREGTPRTVLEAMAMGRPIITTDAPGCRETVTDNENGYLVPVKSVDALVVAMEKYIQTPSLIMSMGEKSRQIAESKYDVHKVNAEMLMIMGIG